MTKTMLEYEEWRKEDLITAKMFDDMLALAKQLRTRNLKGGEAQESLDVFQQSEDIQWLMNVAGTADEE